VRRASSISLTLAALALGVLALCVQPAASQSQTPVPSGIATVLEIKGAIGPATSRYIELGLESAQAREDALEFQLTARHTDCLAREKCGCEAKAAATSGACCR